MEHPNVPQTIARHASELGHLDLATATFVLGRETLLASGRLQMAVWRDKLFAFLSRNTLGATDAFRLPPERVLEIGSQIEL